MFLLIFSGSVSIVPRRFLRMDSSVFPCSRRRLWLEIISPIILMDSSSLEALILKVSSVLAAASFCVAGTAAYGLFGLKERGGSACVALRGMGEGWSNEGCSVTAMLFCGD